MRPPSEVMPHLTPPFSTLSTAPGNNDKLIQSIRVRVGWMGWWWYNVLMAAWITVLWFWVLTIPSASVSNYSRQSCQVLLLISHRDALANRTASFGHRLPLPSNGTRAWSKEFFPLFARRRRLRFFSLPLDSSLWQWRHVVGIDADVLIRIIRGRVGPVLTRAITIPSPPPPPTLRNAFP